MNYRATMAFYKPKSVVQLDFAKPTWKTVEGKDGADSVSYIDKEGKMMLLFAPAKGTEEVKADQFSHKSYDYEQAIRIAISAMETVKIERALMGKDPNFAEKGLSLFHDTNKVNPQSETKVDSASLNLKLGTNNSLGMTLRRGDKSVSHFMSAEEVTLLLDLMRAARPYLLGIQQSLVWE